MPVFHALCSAAPAENEYTQLHYARNHSIKICDKFAVIALRDLPKPANALPIQAVILKEKIALHEFQYSQ